ncbi:MAG TPA: hypothetical protein VMX13_09105 [Sedimentisphaerales bacterium]|nr:hypothetical protein [Sedimentisphaerales bacterium]
MEEYIKFVMEEYTKILLGSVILQAVVCAGFCHFIASEKNRDAGGWMILGFFFGILSMIALAAVPEIEFEDEDSVDDMSENQSEGLANGQWKCRCSQINSGSDKKCIKCGRSPDAIV